MDRKKFVRYLGALKVWQQRLAGYISIINFVMLFYLYITEEPMGLEWKTWLFILTVFIVSIIAIDAKVIMPSSLNYTFKKNPGLCYLKQKLDSNSEKMDIIIKKMEKDK